MTDLSRRSFLGLGALAGASALGAGLAGCAPQTPATAGIEELSDTGTAGTDWLGSAPEIAENDIVETRETDLLVVGAGNGGLMAAATAAELGLNFMLCEKGEMVTQCRHWIGAVNTKHHAEANITVDEGRLLNELARYASNQCDQRVWRTWINESADMIDWLEENLDEVLVLDTEGYDHDTGGTAYYVPPIQHMASLDIERNELLQAYIEGKGYAIDFGYDLQKLVRDEEGGPVTGAVFSTKSGFVQVNAAHIILATGGYAANPDMVRALAPTIPRCVTANGFIPNNDGRGQRAAMWVGARRDAEAAPMIFDRGAVVPGTDAGYDSDSPDASFMSTYGGIGQFMLGSQPFMKVSRDGRRFANESTPYDFICFAAANKPGGVWCQVFDANAAADVARFSTVGCSKAAQLILGSGAPLDEVFADELERGFMMKADTLDELADMLGFAGNTKAAFLAECDRYNELFDKGVDEDFGKEGFRLSELRTAPFYGIWYGGTLLTTVDGISINEDMQVLDEGGSVIEGLYAVGDCSGSLFAGNYPEYIVGCACGRTLTFGRHAVLHAAGQLS